jgi:two-component system, chemotaxis family, protein-glutamate methylesterase/glutaminase
VKTAPLSAKPRPPAARTRRSPAEAHRSTRQIRVMIVDDSLTVRAILKRMVESDPALNVTGTASSGETAIGQLRAVPADVVLLDLEMPGMGGLEALPAILGIAPHIQVLVVSALTEEGAEATLAALAMGAADTMLKPRPGEFTEDYRGALISRIRALGTRAHGNLAEPAPPLARSAPCPLPDKGAARVPGLKRPEIIAIGASTGGIHALGLLLGQFTSALTQPILITQHLPASFMPVFARQIETACARPAVLASDGHVIAPGSIVIASGAGHLTVRRMDDKLVVQLCSKPAPSGCRPSVDPMLESLARACGNRTLAIILSGMGSDGLTGARLLAAAGGTILAQDADSSAVWGMPGVVTRAGLARMVAAPAALGEAVMACAVTRAATSAFS